MSEDGKEVDRGDAVVEEKVDDKVDAGETAEQKADREAAEAKAAKEKEDKKVEVQIPKARFDEAVAKERDRAKKAEERAKELEGKLQTQEKGLDAEKVEKEIEALEEQLDQAIADGNADAKKRLRAEIRGKQQALADAGAQRQAAYATAVAVERVRYDAQVSLLETQHPAMNPDHADYDQEVVAELIELKDAYEAAGMGSTEALKKAAKYVFKTAPEAAKKDIEGDGKAVPTEEEKQKAAEAAAKLKEEAIRKAAEAKGKQPAADADKTGAASDKRGGGIQPSAVAKMSDKDFGKLSDEEKARLRGDTL